MKVTPAAITDSMVDATYGAIGCDKPEKVLDILDAKKDIAAAVNAYLAENPACANGAELLEALKASHRVRCQACHLPEVVMANEQVKAVLAKVEGGEA